MGIHPDRPIAGDVQEQHLERAARFKRRAEPRFNETLRQLRLLEKCANPKFYFYTRQQVERMIGVLRAQLDRTEAAFRDEQKPRNEWVSL